MNGVPLCGGLSPAVVFVGAAVYFSARRSAFAWTLALGAFFLAGALHIQVRSGSSRLDTSIQPYADRQELQITAHVTRDGRLQPGGFGEIRQTLDVEAEEVQTAAGQTVPTHSGIRLNIYSPRSQDAADGASRARPDPTARCRSFTTENAFASSAKLKLPRNFRNPGAFDYQGYLGDHGIAASGLGKDRRCRAVAGFLR